LLWRRHGIGGGRRTALAYIDQSSNAIAPPC
jgi:hypothetical protein